MRPMPVLEHFIAITQASGTETMFTVRSPDGEVVSLNLNDVFKELHDGFRALERLVDARTITDRGGMGGLGGAN